jgi:NADPH:quinone reductase-like Zn-dependent oxidoreductase
VHSAAGGVGQAVAQLGRILGVRVLGLASAGKHAVLREWGVEPFDSRAPRWWDAVRRTAPQGVDIVLDPIGGDSWRRGYALLAPAGRLVCYGAAVLSGGGRRNLPRTLWHLARSPWFHPLPLMNQNRAVAGVNLGHLWDAEGVLRPQLEALLGYARDGRIRPHVDRAFPLAEGAAAHRYLQERRNIGKVVLIA